MSKMVAATDGSKERSMSRIWCRLMYRSLLFSKCEISADDAVLLPKDAMASSRFGVLLLPDSAATTMVLKKLLSPSL